MPQISIGQVENLEDLVRDLKRIQEIAHEECSVMMARAEAKVTEVEEETRHSQMLLEEAENALREAQQVLEEAEQRLQEAENRLNEAEAQLSACEAGGDYDEDGNFIPPDCSWEEGAVSSAEAELSEANSACTQAREKEAEAQERQRRMQNRLELARETLSKARELLASLTAQIRARLGAIDSLVQTGVSRLSRAKAALDAYLAINRVAGMFYKWLHPQQSPNHHASPAHNAPHANKHAGPAPQSPQAPQAKKPAPPPPKELNVRLNLPPDQVKEFLEYLSYRDLSFREKAASFSKEFAAAKGPAERKLILDKARKFFSEAIAEKIAEYGLRPFGDVKVDDKIRPQKVEMDEDCWKVIFGKGEQDDDEEEGAE